MFFFTLKLVKIGYTFFLENKKVEYFF